MHNHAASNVTTPAATPRIVAALLWALSTDDQACAILKDCPDLLLTHGVLQATGRRTSWIVAISATCLSVMRIGTAACGDSVARNLTLPEHLRSAS